MANIEKFKTAKELFDAPMVAKKFNELLGKNSGAFITSVLQVVANSALLAKADPLSIYNAAATAATLNLPINQNLGLAYIIPYNSKQPDGTFKMVAQFQIGYKGFIQLAQRSGQFHRISASPIYDGQILSNNPLTGYEFDFSVAPQGEPVGFAAYFRLKNGYEATLYMTKDELMAHGKKYSKTAGKAGSLWTSDFPAMALKTTLKLLLSRYAPLSIEMQDAITMDQAAIEGDVVRYVDNEEPKIDKEAERVLLLINDSKTIEELESMQALVNTEGLSEAYIEKHKELSDGN